MCSATEDWRMHFYLFKYSPSVQEAVNTVCLGLCHCQSVSSVSLFLGGISGIKCVQDKIFGIFYVQIHENLQICREFSEISLSKNQKKGNLRQK